MSATVGGLRTFLQLCRIPGDGPVGGELIVGGLTLAWTEKCMQARRWRPSGKFPSCPPVGPQVTELNRLPTFQACVNCSCPCPCSCAGAVGPVQSHWRIQPFTKGGPKPANADVINAHQVYIGKVRFEKGGANRNLALLDLNLARLPPPRSAGVQSVARAVVSVCSELWRVLGNR